MQKTWKACTFVVFGQASSGQNGRPGGAMRRTAPAWGLGQCGREISKPVEAAEGHKTVAGAYLSGRGTCAQYDPKVILGATNPRP